MGFNSVFVPRFVVSFCLLITHFELQIAEGDEKVPGKAVDGVKANCPQEDYQKEKEDEFSVLHEVCEFVKLQVCYASLI